ncbi:MAG: protein kinase [Planctomycetes bacterium]|nr:protein kinase [Planctomycetota bacterium]
MKADKYVTPSCFARRFPECRTRLLEELQVQLAFDLFPDFASREIEWPEINKTVLDQYEIPAELGRGSFSRVYLAKDTSLGNRSIVVKIARWLIGKYEADCLGQFDPPSICQVHSIHHDHDRGTSLIVMPFVSETTLRDLTDRQFASNTGFTAHALRVSSFGADIAGALEYLHEQDYVHGDVKPSNILVSGKRAILVEFITASRGLSYAGRLWVEPRLTLPQTSQNHWSTKMSTGIGFPLTMFSAWVLHCISL